ncbi:MAG: hypothetical protein ACPGID_01500 [Rubricella sp.]
MHSCFEGPEDVKFMVFIGGLVAAVALSALPAHATDRLERDGTVYAVEYNQFGAVIRADGAPRSEIFYLGLGCDALHPQFGDGIWGAAQGHVFVDFLDGQSFDFTGNLTAEMERTCPF